LEGRRLKDNLALLPLDVKKEQSEILGAENLDETLTLLEDGKTDLVPVDDLGFVYSKKGKGSVKSFLKWVLTDGQGFNHVYGFLTLDGKTLAYQKKLLESYLLTTTD
jgi:hypothetical protein